MYYYYNIIFPPCYNKNKNEKKEERSGRQNKNKKSKFCGASSNSNTICINVHNRHDFYFIVSPSSQITSIITYYILQQQKEKQKTSKKFTTVTNYQQTLVARSVGLWPFGLRKARQSPSSFAAATLHEEERRRKKALPFELCKGGTLSYELLCIGRLSLYAFNTTF